MDRKDLFETMGFEKIQDSAKRVIELINEPFYEYESNFFVNGDWISVEIANDFFIESHNFLLLQALMELSAEDYWFMTYAFPNQKTVYYKISSNIDINRIRNVIENNSDRYTDWVFISPSKKWACLSIYDRSAIYLGYDREYAADLRLLINNNPDFVKFL